MELIPVNVVVTCDESNPKVNPYDTLAVIGIGLDWQAALLKCEELQRKSENKRITWLHWEPEKGYSLIWGGRSDERTIFGSFLARHDAGVLGRQLAPWQRLIMDMYACQIPETVVQVALLGQSDARRMYDFRGAAGYDRCHGEPAV